MTSIQSATIKIIDRSDRPSGTKIESMQNTFTAVLQKVGKDGYVSAVSPEADLPLDKQMVSSWEQYFDEFSHLRYSGLTERITSRSEAERSLTELKKDFGSVMLRAYNEGGYATPRSFVQSLSHDELETVRKAQGLADAIDPNNLKEEAALNLLIPQGAQADENRDGLVSIGAANMIEFPNSRTPSYVKEAWDKATAGLDPMEKGQRGLDVMLPLLLRNIHPNPEGTVHRYVEPGAPDWINPFEDPTYSYKEAAENWLKYLDRFRNEMTTEQYQSGKEFWSSFRDQLRDQIPLKS